MDFKFFFCFSIQFFFFCHFFLHSRNDNSDNFSCVADDHNVDDDKEKEELGQDYLLCVFAYGFFLKIKRKSLHNSILFFSSCVSL